MRLHSILPIRKLSERIQRQSLFDQDAGNLGCQPAETQTDPAATRCSNLTDQRISATQSEPAPAIHSARRRSSFSLRQVFANLRLGQNIARTRLVSSLGTSQCQSEIPERLSENRPIQSDDEIPVLFTECEIYVKEE